ncbi:hybrid sensor histidine kinase/response regulator [Frateuria soli]|uniref:hybrid sensor histidine kinase/response regulator n=1 Tax=Frateuria soli TaxID=1542730 RepID=UPI001E46072D|nr:PAS domain-containing sensor histidine kinase [Frateuria soli]UGB39206.1 PAS domain S-box protein [Frateuria soli]
MSIGGDNYARMVQSLDALAMIFLDTQGRIATWNAGAERIFGYAAGEIVGQPFQALHTPEGRAAGLPEQALRAASKEGRDEETGWRLGKDEQRVWARTIIEAVRGESGELTGYVYLVRDIPWPHHSDDMLGSNEQQFSLLVQGVRDYAIYLLDADGRVASWNAGAQRIKGYRVDEVLGKHFSHFYADEDVSTGRPARNLAVARTQGVYEGEGWRKRKDGSLFWAHVVIDRLTDAEGRVVGFAKITRDVTEKKRAEEELAVAREALFQSQKSESIGHLTGGVAHDFNNLLMAVMGNLELLRKWLPPEARPQLLLDNAMAGAQRGAALTQRMLAFARRQELHPRPVDVPLLVHGMAELIRRSLGPEIRIGTSFPLHLPRVLIDPNQLELALLNLAVNGRDAMPHGGRLEIGARNEHVGEGHSTALPPGEYVCLWVADEGHGMDADTLKRATEPFFTTKGVGKGTGLGLSMAYGLAEQSGGRLLLQSQPGRGTTVEVWLPIAADMAEPAAPAAVEGVDRDAPVHTGEPLALLMVDDDELVLLSTMAMAEDLGHVVHAVRSAEEALAYVDAGGEVDVVITDQAMPGMTGTRLAKLLRERKPDLPIVLASGYAELPGTPIKDLVRLGKPFTRLELHRAIGDAAGQLGVTEQAG